MKRVRYATQPGNYRVDAVTEDTLLEVLDDPAQSPTHRIGAALALSSGNRPRIQAAAEETADPALASALTEAAEGELTLDTLERLVKR